MRKVNGCGKASSDVDACRQAHRVLFAAATDWVTRLQDAHLRGRLARRADPVTSLYSLFIRRRGRLPTLRTRHRDLSFQLVSSNRCSTKALRPRTARMGLLSELRESEPGPDTASLARRASSGSHDRLNTSDQQSCRTSRNGVSRAATPRNKSIPICTRNASPASSWPPISNARPATAPVRPTISARSRTRGPDPDASGLQLYTCRDSG